MTGGVRPQSRQEASSEAAGWQRSVADRRFGSKYLILQKKPPPAHRSYEG